jgi:ribosomal protein S18 acetylase RimI-like enzyme
VVDPSEVPTTVASTDARSQEEAIWLELIAVNTEYRGRQLGERLTKYCEQRGRAQLFKRIELCVDPGNEAAQRFYRRLGYHLIGPSGSGLLFSKTLRANCEEANS